MSEIYPHIKILSWNQFTVQLFSNKVMYFDEIFAIKSLGENQISHCAIPFIFFKAKISWKHRYVILLFPRKIFCFTKMIWRKWMQALISKCPLKIIQCLTFCHATLWENDGSLRTNFLWNGQWYDQTNSLCAVCSTKEFLFASW